MKVNTGILCRGTGAYYVELLVSDLDSGNTVEVEAQIPGGRPVPLQQYQGLIKGDEQQIVCKLPFMQAPLTELVCREITPQGTCIAECTKRVTNAQIVWASRVNYRLRGKHTSAVRSICDRLDYTYVSMIPTFFLADRAFSYSPNPHHILKVRIGVPFNEGVRVRVLDGFGNQLHDDSIGPEAFSKFYPEELWGEHIYAANYSYRVPDDGNTYCIMVETLESKKVGFVNIDRDTRESFRLTFNCSFYKVGTVEYYHRALASGKLGSQSTTLIADPSIDAGLFSIVVPLYQTPLLFLYEMIESVLNQVYSHWELVLVNASPENTELAQALSELNDARIRVIEVSENKGIAENTNVGIRAATGEYIFLLDHDDFLDPWALYEYARAILDDPALDVLYCDEDCFEAGRGFVNPHLKSDFNIDLLRCHNYVTHFLALRASLMKELMLDSAYDAAQDYDLILRASEKTRAIKHIPHILYHWRMHDLSTSKNHDTKTEAGENGRLALQAHLDRCGIKAHTELTEFPYIYRAVYEVDGSPLVSILIPNKDNADVLRRCIESIDQKTTYRNFEIIVIENNSVEPETFDMYQQLERTYPNVKVVTWEHEFNYSKINNFGAQHATGDYLLLLNNDTEVINPEWLGSMTALCQRPDVGIVGAKLLFPDDSVQHAGIIMVRSKDAAYMGGPSHIFLCTDASDPNYMYRASLKQDLSAVTGACLMTKRDLYQELGGLCEDFVVAYNDVDYCLRVREKDLLVVYDPDALLYHYESLTRGADTLTSGTKNYARFLSEQGLLRSRWGRYFAEGDPYHSIFATLYIEEWE